MNRKSKALSQDNCIDLINNELENLRVDVNRAPKNLYEPINYILSIGGKRLRPTLVLLAANLFADEIKDAVKPALAMEVFHNFTLLHDDIMDKADKRRGKLTVHKKWNENIAILSGDAMAIMAYELLRHSKSEYLSEILLVFNKISLEVCEGQQYDMDYENSNNISIPDYLNMIKLKTSVLLAGSLKIGAILGGAGKKNAELLYDFGLNLGLSFQLQDDYLDVFGDEKTFGKSIGGDIVANKKTYLLLKAYELANGQQKQELDFLLSEKDIERSKKIQRVKSIYSDLRVADYLKKEMDYYYQKSKVALDSVTIDISRKEELQSFATNLMKREN